MGKAYRPDGNHLQGISDSPTRAAAVAPNDTDDLEHATTVIHVGTAGDVAVITAAGDQVTFQNVSGQLVGSFTRILAAGTTASGIVAQWG